MQAALYAVNAHTKPNQCGNLKAGYVSKRKRVILFYTADEADHQNALTVNQKGGGVAVVHPLRYWRASMFRSLSYAVSAASLAAALTLPAIANDDLFAGDTGEPITGSVTANDGSVDGSVTLLFPPRRGTLATPAGASGLGTDGQFFYTPAAGFEGADQFIYSAVIDGQEKVIAARIFSGRVEILSATDRNLGLVATGAENRSPVTLGGVQDAQGALWRVLAQPGGVYFETALNDEAGTGVLETWQPNAAGTDVTVYQSNRRDWQLFSLETTAQKNDAIRSAYTGNHLKIAFGDVTAGEPSGGLADDWLIAGSGQTAPPSPQDDLFAGAIDEVISGRVLSNDTANSIDFASFLVSRPRNGDFVGIYEAIYGGLAPFGDFSYQPTPGFQGIDEFTYLVLGSSGGAPSRLVTVTLQVGEVDANQPVARSDFFATPADTVVDGRVLTNDTNEGDGFFDPQAVLVERPSHGEFVGINQSVYDGLAPFGAFSYQPEPGFSGLDSFAYRILNNGKPSDVTTVFIAVGDVRLAPHGVASLAVNAASDDNRTPFTLERVGNPARQTFQILPIGQTGQVQLQFNNKSLETWQPEAAGTDVTLYRSNTQVWQDFEITADDETGSFRIQSAYTSNYVGASETVEGQTLTANPLGTDGIEDRWLIAGLGQAFSSLGVDDTFAVAAGETIEGNVLNNDDRNGGADLASFLVTRPTNGELIGINQLIYDGLAPFGSFEYQPNPGFVGEDSFVYKVLSSGEGAPSRYVTVRVTVTP